MGAETKTNKPRTIRTALIAAIPALVTGYLNHQKDETSRAALVNESIRLEQRINQCEAKADRNSGFLRAATLFGLGTVVPSLPAEPVSMVHAVRLETVADGPDTSPLVVETVTTATAARAPRTPVTGTKARQRQAFEKRYEALF